MTKDYSPGPVAEINYLNTRDEGGSLAEQYVEMFNHISYQGNANMTINYYFIPIRLSTFRKLDKAKVRKALLYLTCLESS